MRFPHGEGNLIGGLQEKHSISCLLWQLLTIRLRAMPQALVSQNDRVLVTGASGFIGRRVVASLLEQGFTNVVCLVRPSPTPVPAEVLFGNGANDHCVELFCGNLMSQTDCERIAAGAKVVIHLAASRGEKSYPDAFLNSVVTTRRLLDACVNSGSVRRFVNVSSFAVYSNRRNPRGRLLDESAPVDDDPAQPWPGILLRKGTAGGTCDGLLW